MQVLLCLAGYHAARDFLGKLKENDPVQLGGDFIGNSQEAAVARGNEVAENIILHHGNH
ncbi:MAG: hypothetical protein OXC05_00945 [Halieaceae bacterium]|nr:hypothetical protein [Halieaceae bacterium]